MINNNTLLKTGTGKQKYRYHQTTGGDKKSKGVICIETGIEYSSLTECSKKTGFQISAISRHLNFPEIRGNVSGFTFKYK